MQLTSQNQANNACSDRKMERMFRANEVPRCKQQGINRNISNLPKGRGIYPLSARLRRIRNKMFYLFS